MKLVKLFSRIFFLTCLALISVSLWAQDSSQGGEQKAPQQPALPPELQILISQRTVVNGTRSPGYGSLVRLYLFYCW